MRSVSNFLPFFSKTINSLYLTANRNKGMQYLIGKHWRDIFDVIIVQARKPKFFTDKNRPFRIYDLNHQNHVWDKVRKLEKGQVYTEVRF